jgi:hypothetical protein
MLTKGWDTISIIKQDKINSDLEKSWDSSKAKFDYIDPNRENIHISGIFDCWSIVNGGGGRLLRLSLPIRSGEFTLESQKFNISGCTAILEVTLSMLQQSKVSVVLKTEFLQIATEKDEVNTEQGGWLIPITLIDPSGEVDVFSHIILTLITQSLIAHSHQFDLLLADMNFVKKGSPQWAIPKKWTYSYLDSGYLSILSVCSNKDISKLPLDVDVAKLGLEANSFYVMSNELMLENLILPNLTEIYQNCDSSDFFYKSGELLNKRNLSMHKIKSGAINYTPVVYKENNIVTTSGNKISIFYNGDCSLYVGIMMNWNGFLYLKCTLNKSGTIDFYESDKNFNHSQNIPWYLRWLSPAVGIIVSVVVKVISDDLIDSIKREASSINAQDINTITWCHDNVKVQSVYIDEALVMTY